MTFDTFVYAEGLKNSGFSEEQVRGLTQELTKALKSEDLATKQDVENLAATTKQDIKDLAAATKQDIAELQISTELKISEAKIDIIKWIGGMIATGCAIMIAALKVFLT